MEERERIELKGFNCEFTNSPPEIVQTKCPVCLLIIREPHQVTCCGNSFCQSCIESIKTVSKPCPSCETEKFTIFPDKRLMNTLYAFNVCCSHKKEGCEWTGELGQLDKHLNTDPESEKQLNGCQFVELPCPHCGHKTKCQDLNDHLQECIKRPISCEYCKEYTSHQDNVIYNHWPVCESFPVSCPNECGSNFKRQNLNSHVADECPLTTISCDFHHVGCAVTLSRKEMPDHLKENLLTHISLLAISHGKQQEEIKQLTKEKKSLKSAIEHLTDNHQYQQATGSRMRAQYNELATQSKFLKFELKSLKEENGRLKQELTSLSTQVHNRVSDTLVQVSLPIVPSAVLTMTEFQHHKKNRDEWLSPAVYTHHQGYKIRLGVYANGHGIGEGTHVTVLVYILKGEFDDSLKWPFRGVVWFRLLDQVKGEDHRTGSNMYDDKVSERLCGRVLEGEQVSGLGLNKFIAHAKLEPKYLRNNILQFQIHKVQLH